MVVHYYTIITAAAVSIPSLDDQDRHNDQNESFPKRLITSLTWRRLWTASDCRNQTFHLTWNTPMMPGIITRRSTTDLVVFNSGMPRTHNCTQASHLQKALHNERKSLSTVFGPYIPIFVPWTDVWLKWKFKVSEGLNWRSWRRAERQCPTHNCCPNGPSLETGGNYASGRTKNTLLFLCQWLRSRVDSLP